MLLKSINIMNPKINCNWLDLGCKNCKLFNDISVYKPKKYLGMDIDINQLSKGLKLYDKYPDTFQLFPCNLAQDFTSFDIKWSVLDFKIKYNYIIANFSLMHFCNDIFWKQLDIITEKGSKFIFNLVKKNVSWKYKDSYLISNDNETNIYFKWVHNSEKIEQIINIEEYLNNYNWSIIYKTEVSGSNSHELVNCYDWFIIQKN